MIAPVTSRSVRGVQVPVCRPSPLQLSPAVLSGPCSIRLHRSTFVLCVLTAFAAGFNAAVWAIALFMF